MKIRDVSVLLVIMVASFLLVACSNLSSSNALVTPVSQEKISADLPPTGSNVVEGSQAKTDTQSWVDQASRSDGQGAVVVEITPVNLNTPNQTIDFQVSMNTHLIDLSMDLAALSSLTTDTGYSVQAIRWDGPSGGHHVNGTLSFPATLDGIRLLSSANKLTITLANVDAPERVFVWEK